MSDEKSVILCADDFAQDASISDGIQCLAEAGRLSAVSCFTDSPQWPARARALVRARHDLLIGLHFNLSFGFGFGEKPLQYWLLRSLVGSLELVELRTALTRQLDRFSSATGRLPDFIDGHEHVHAFPGIREVVKEAAEAWGDRAPICVRDVSRPIGATDARFKRCVIGAMARLGGGPPGCRPLNTGFGGDYSLSVRAPYGALFASWLDAGPPGSLIMCHPRFPRDSVATTARDVEFEFLGSLRCLDALARSRTRLVRAPRGLPGAVSAVTGLPSTGEEQKESAQNEGYLYEPPSNSQSSAASLPPDSPRAVAGRARVSNRHRLRRIDGSFPR